MCHSTGAGSDEDYHCAQWLATKYLIDLLSLTQAWACLSPDNATGVQARLVMHRRTQKSGWSCTCPGKHIALQLPEEAAI